MLGIDLSMGQLRIAQRLGTARFVQADLCELDLRAGSVDAVVSFYALGHLPAAAHAPLLRRIGDWLRPGGLLLTSAPLTAGEDVEDNWLEVPMFFGGIGVDATLDAVAAAGLRLESAETVTHEENGGLVSFLWVTATRPINTSVRAHDVRHDG